MDMDRIQEQVVEVVERYGRPHSSEEHLIKLGEEFGELAVAIVRGHESPRLALQQNIADECVDMINVLLSLMDQIGFKPEHRIAHKLTVLNERMNNGRFDRRWGKT